MTRKENENLLETDTEMTVITEIADTTLKQLC